MSNKKKEESALEFFAVIFILTGIGFTIVCINTMVMVDSGETRFIEEKVFNPLGLAYSLGVLLSTLITGVLLMVVSNISQSLIEIRKEFKDFMEVYLEEDE